MSAVMQSVPTSNGLHLYKRQGGKYVKDERAHERLDTHEAAIASHTTILQDISTSMKANTKALETMSTQMKPVTRTIMVMGWFQKAVVWASPMVLIGIAVYNFYITTTHGYGG